MRQSVPLPFFLDSLELLFLNGHFVHGIFCHPAMEYVALFQILLAVFCYCVSSIPWS